LKRTVITIRPAALIGIGIPDRAALLVSALRLGTGKYKEAQGEVKVVQISETEFQLTFKIID
jgi:hypothetical protein